MKMDSKFSSNKNLVVQITPNIDAGEIAINGKHSKRTASFIFIPKLDGTKLFCPLNYFQDSCSLAGKWILDDNQNKVFLDGVNNIGQVIISIKSPETEKEVNISGPIKCRLLDYFKIDIARNLAKFLGFDCHAFVCFLLGLKCIPEAPSFDFEEKEPGIGEVVVFCTRNELPESIKHWAIFLGEGLCISKFGESTGQADAHVAIMDFAGVHYLYNTESIFTATPKSGATKWDGTFRRMNKSHNKSLNLAGGGSGR